MKDRKSKSMESFRYYTNFLRVFFQYSSYTTDTVPNTNRELGQVIRPLLFFYDLITVHNECFNRIVITMNK